MCKIYKHDEFNSNQRITSDAMLHKGLDGFDYHRSMVHLIFLYFTASDHNKLYYTTFL